MKRGYKAMGGFGLEGNLVLFGLTIMGGSEASRHFYLDMSSQRYPTASYGSFRGITARFLRCLEIFSFTRTYLV